VDKDERKKDGNEPKQCVCVCVFPCLYLVFFCLLIRNVVEQLLTLPVLPFSSIPLLWGEEEKDTQGNQNPVGCTWSFFFSTYPSIKYKRLTKSSTLSFLARPLLLTLLCF
jgi:hypothetical protein